ncbi:MAG: hypothetical protein LC689_06765 [Myxococcales bacterium]|nr:hypothetical protein [Myxococcales bacterium]
MRARFSLAADVADRLLRPALADWRDAVGCADPLLLPANAATEPQLVPLPLPSWCIWLIDAGVLEVESAAVLEGPRIVLHAALAVVREAELEGVERFPVTFAGRHAPGAPHLHLAISPPFLAQSWRGPICIRAAVDKARVWIGGPASPVAAAPGVSGETVATWAVDPEPASGTWPGWPRWIVVRQLEGREPQALWSLPALWKARHGEVPEAGFGGAPAAAVSMRLGIDLGSTSTVVVEEDDATAGAPGAKLLSRQSSGFRRLAGDSATAHRFGCAEQLMAPAGHLPTALAAGSAEALSRLLEDPGAYLQLWLPQAGEGDPPITADRFKSPELLLLSEWLAGLQQRDPKAVSRTLLEAYGRLLGRSLAAAHATPLVVAEGGRWALRWPRLENAQAVLTYPQCAWTASASEPFQSVFDGVGAALCEGLRQAWGSASHQLVADPLAARTASGQRAEAIEAFVDFGGLTVQVTVRIPEVRARPEPLIAGSSMTYLLGGERILDAASFAAADADREKFRAAARAWRSLISRGGHADAEGAAAIREAIFDVVLALVLRQIEATLRRAALDHAALNGARLRLFLLGEGWKLAALDVNDEQREAAATQRIERWFAERASAELVRIDKRRLCEGALQAAGGNSPEETSVELHGVDTGPVLQRWFAVAAGSDAKKTIPLAADPWWRDFAGAEPSLLRMEQWFGAGPGALAAGLAGGPIGFDGGRSVLKQWLDVSGASLIALRIHAALR